MELSKEKYLNKFPCPCCQSLVYCEPANGDLSVCPVCQWKDDPVQSENPDFFGGANELSLNETRRRFVKLVVGNCGNEYVR